MWGKGLVEVLLRVIVLSAVWMPVARYWSKRNYLSRIDPAFSDMIPQSGLDFSALPREKTGSE